MKYLQWPLGLLVFSLIQIKDGFGILAFSGFVKGKPGVIPKGRELKARTGEAIAYTIPPLSVATLDASALTAIPGDMSTSVPTQSPAQAAPNPF